MPSEFPGSPRVLKGGVVVYRLPDLSPTVIVFQYNPDEVSRSLQMPSVAGSTGRGEANRLNGPPQETLTLSVEIDATDQLEKLGENATAVENRLHPVIASIERLVYPSYPLVIAKEAPALAFILNEMTPLTLLEPLHQGRGFPSKAQPHSRQSGSLSTEGKGVPPVLCGKSSEV